MAHAVTHVREDSFLPGVARRVAVVNGDDFGFSRGVNQAIIEAHERGVLTSASLMVTAERFDEAVELAKQNPGLAVGLHLALVCGRGALSPKEIPNLVDRNGLFPFSPFRTGLRYQFSSNARRELALEIRAQLERFASTGLRLSHVDGHLHMHSHPVVMRLLVEFAGEFGIRTIRLPSEELKLTLGISRSNLINKVIWSAVFRRLRIYEERLLKRAGIDYLDRVYGLLQSGQMSEDYLLSLIPQIKAKRFEIYCHPARRIEGEPLNGPPDAGEIELNALISDRVRRAFEDERIQLSNFMEAETFIEAETRESLSQ